MDGLSLSLLPGIFTVCRFPSEEPLPEGIESSRFFSATRTDEELSLVCEQELASNLSPEKKEEGWRCLKVLGPLDFSLTGILSSLTEPLAKERITVFALSTFDTDYLLLKDTSLKKAIQVLGKAGFGVKTNLSSTN